MKNKNILKLLILFLAVTSITVKTFADEVEQTVILSVSPTVSAQKIESTENATLNSATGVLDRSLQTVYEITTNGYDSDYDFTVTSSILNSSGTPVSAYGDNCILFGHTVNRPTDSAINNAKQKGSQNYNVIAYPVSTTITEPMISTFKENYKTFGNCFVIETKDATTATFTHIIGSSPVGGTYNAGQDESGTYQSTIVISVTPKN